MRFGAFALVPSPNGFWGIKCSKGRGLIIPGGTFDRDLDATIVETAKRELREETGIEGQRPVYLWHGPDMQDRGDLPPYITYTFLFNGLFAKPFPNDHFDAEEVIEVNWNDLSKSSFKGYYQCLYDHLAHCMQDPIVRQLCRV